MDVVITRFYLVITTSYLVITNITVDVVIKALNRILSVFTGHMNCIKKNSTLSGAWKFAILSDAIHMAREHRQNAIQYIYIFYNKFVAIFLTLTQRMLYLSNLNRTKSKTLRTASRKMTNWTKPPCDPVQKIDIFKSLIIVNTATSYFFTNLHVIYFWKGHWEKRSSHWHLQFHTRLAERCRWRCAA